MNLRAPILLLCATGFVSIGHAQSGVPTTMVAASPVSLLAPPGTDVSQPPAVLVRDALTKPVSGVTVTFAVTAGGGVIKPLTVTTGADGVARLTSWTVGSLLGTNTVTATVKGLPVVTFSASWTYSLTVLVKRSDGSPMERAQVCVGSRTNVDQYAAVKSADAKGAVSFALPGQPEYGITSAKAGYVGTTTFQRGNTATGQVTMTLNTGSGGATCPGMAIEYESTTIAAAPPNAPPDLNVSVTQAANPIIAGNNQTYTVTVYNRGGSTAGNVLVRSNLPTDLTLQPSTADHGFVCARSGAALNCSSGVIAAGDSAKIRVVMNLPVTALSGHTILFSATADPDRAIAEGNELNNTASTYATTQALIAPIVEYRATTAADVSELFRLAQAKGFQFAGVPLDRDVLGNPVVCEVRVPAAGDSGPPTMYSQESVLRAASQTLTKVFVEYRCLFEFFKSGTLPAGWELRDATWRPVPPPLPGFTPVAEYVTRPNSPAGNAFFSVQTRWREKFNHVEVTAITLRGPAGKTWRDAFK